MKALLTLIIISLSAYQLLADSIDLYTFKMENGTTYSFSISRALYDSQQVLEPVEEELPLTPGAAAKIARQAIRSLVPPEYFDRLKCGGMTLSQMPNPDHGGAETSKKWMYHVHLRTDRSDVLGDMPILYNRVIILMDGTPILLKEK